MGYGSYFTDDRTGNTTDDHLYVNTLAKIPCIDIVHMDPRSGTYGDHHHTQKDNLDIIDKNTLKVVGQTVLEVLYQEQVVLNGEDCFAYLNSYHSYYDKVRTLHISFHFDII